MENKISFAQLLKQAIDNHLLDVHTALIGRIEKYDASTQLADIQPVLKRAIKTGDGTIKQEQLPLLVDVPILFLRAGEFFISLPVEVGDYVQVIFNEAAIDDFLSESSSSIDSARRFTLQGAVGVPGIYPQAKALKSAHRANLVIGRDDGIQLHIDQEKIRLGSEKAEEALAIASRVEAELKKIINVFNGHTHTGACPTGTVSTVISTSQLGPVGDISTKKVVAE
jgi:hypothetical protein